MELVETPVFTRQVTHQLDAEDFRALQVMLLAHPEIGAIIPRSGGLRKLRWHLPGRGKRGGVRLIYYWNRAQERIFLLFLYPKNVQADLTPLQLRTLRNLISEE